MLPSVQHYPQLSQPCALHMQRIHPEKLTLKNYQMNLSNLYQTETLAAAADIPQSTVNGQSHRIGMQRGEPIIVILDALLSYAKSYRYRYESALCDDHVLGVYWRDALQAVHGLLDGDGGEALRLGRTTDSKDNGACEKIYWAAMEAAGFKDETL